MVVDGFLLLVDGPLLLHIDKLPTTNLVPVDKPPCTQLCSQIVIVCITQPLRVYVCKYLCEYMNVHHIREQACKLGRAIEIGTYVHTSKYPLRLTIFLSSRNSAWFHSPVVDRSFAIIQIYYISSRHISLMSNCMSFAVVWKPIPGQFHANFPFWSVL